MLQSKHPDAGKPSAEERFEGAFEKEKPDQARTDPTVNSRLAGDFHQCYSIPLDGAANYCPPRVCRILSLERRVIPSTIEKYRFVREWDTVFSPHKLTILSRTWPSPVTNSR